MTRLFPESFIPPDMTYLPRLDGLRAIAILGVLLEHFGTTRFVFSLSPGGAGVALFFVLSGYLISRLLLGYRDRGVPVRSAARHFWWRRLLRLSPPLWLLIATTALVGADQMREQWWIHGLYLTNLRIALDGRWSTGADHFYSLATEEQFYLLWFFLVVALPRRWLLPAIGTAIGITLACRLVVWAGDMNVLRLVALPGDLADLATGSLLAVAEAGARRSPVMARLVRLTLDPRVAGATGAAFVASSLGLVSSRLDDVVLYPFVASAFFACLVIRAARPGPDRAMDWLAWAPLRHVGKISYGVYVYHLFVREVLAHLPVVGPRVAAGGWPIFPLLAVASLAAAQMSWMWLERPLARWKDRVPEPAGGPRATA